MKFSSSVYKLEQLPIVKNWCKNISPKFDALRIRNRWGTVIETLSIDDTIMKYQGCRVLNYFDEGETTILDVFLWL